MIVRCLGAFVLASLVGGCATLDGPPVVMRATGPVMPKLERDNQGLILRFSESAQKSAEDGANAGLAKAMLEDGFTLVYAHCNDFFLHAGREQSQLLVVKDVTAAVGTLAAGGIALATKGNGGRTALGIVTLSTSATLSGVDIYSQRYLFGAENIDAVRELTLNALAAHSVGVRRLEPTTYNAVVGHIFDNQAICTPRRIAMLARDAIQKGKVEALPTAADGATRGAAEADDTVLQDVSNILSMPSKIDATTAGALFWLLERRSTQSEQAKRIRPLLSAVPTASNPFDSAGKLRDPIPNEAALHAALSKFSSEAVLSFDKQIADMRDTVALAGAGAPLPQASFTLPQRAKGDGRVAVSVQ